MSFWITELWGGGGGITFFQALICFYTETLCQWLTRPTYLGKAAQFGMGWDMKKFLLPRQIHCSVVSGPADMRYSYSYRMCTAGLVWRANLRFNKQNLLTGSANDAHCQHMLLQCAVCAGSCKIEHFLLHYFHLKKNPPPPPPPFCFCFCFVLL